MGQRGARLTGFPELQPGLQSGKGNVNSRNIAIDPDGGFAMEATHRDGRFSRNVGAGCGG